MKEIGPEGCMSSAPPSPGSAMQLDVDVVIDGHNTTCTLENTAVYDIVYIEI